MLLGPSPGKDPQMEGKSKEETRPTRTVYCGLRQGEIEFPDNTRRNALWNKLALSLCENNRDYAFALTSVGNLDWWYYGREKDIPADALRNGCEFVWTVT